MLIHCCSYYLQLIHDESSRELESKLAVVSEVKHHMEKANDLFVNNDCINAEKYYTSSIEVLFKFEFIQIIIILKNDIENNPVERY